MADINPALKSYLDFLVDSRETRWKRIKQLRDYEEGTHQSQMTDKQKILLVGAKDNDPTKPKYDPDFTMNVSPLILSTETDRLAIQRVYAKTGDEALDEKLNALFEEWLDETELSDALEDVFYSAGKDGDGHLIAFWDDDMKQPSASFNEAYDGDSGTEMAYKDLHPGQPIYAVKRWDVELPKHIKNDTSRVRRMNIYFEDRIEVYISADGGDYNWRQLEPGDPDYDEEIMEEVKTKDVYGTEYDATIIPWTNKQGEPYGNACKHFRHLANGGTHGVSTIDPIVPGLQDAINSSAISLFVATKLNGFKEVVVTGFYPDKKDQEIVRYPSATHYFEDPDANVTQLSETDLRQLSDVLNAFLTRASTLTATPVTAMNLVGLGQLPGADTQKQLDQQLVAKTEKNQRKYARPIVELFRTLLKLEADYGQELKGTSFEQINKWKLKVEWESAEVRNEEQENETAKVHYELGVPQGRVWLKLGYSAQEVKEMEQESTSQQGQIASAVRALLNQGGDEEPDEEPEPEEEQEVEDEL